MKSNDYDDDNDDDDDDGDDDDNDVQVQPKYCAYLGVILYACFMFYTLIECVKARI